ncbi:MAG: hypothetical protein R2861_04895 [Desulfobacterales bacterium]
MAEIARDKAYRKLATGIASKNTGYLDEHLIDADKKGGHRRPGGGRKRRTGRRHHGE